MRDQRRYSPVAAVKALASRAEAVAGSVFAADLLHLRWLAERLVESEAQVRAGDEGATGALRDFTREFGLQLRNTAKQVSELEDRLADQVVEMSDDDWKNLVSGDEVK